MAMLPGILPSLLERYLLERDEALFERVLRRSGLDQAEPWVAAAEYPESDFRRLLAAAAAELELDPQRLLHDAARWAVPLLMRRFASLVAGLAEPLEFLEALGPTVYPQLCRMLRCRTEAEYEYTRTGPRSCRVVYRSPRQLCAGLEGGLAGLAGHLGASLRIDHAHCQRRGDPQCRLDLEFNGVSP
jgi:hypothetical protein